MVRANEYGKGSIMCRLVTTAQFGRAETGCLALLLRNDYGNLHVRIAVIINEVALQNLFVEMLPREG